jgi:hypothetical protein
MYRKILGFCAALVALGAPALAPSLASAHTLQDTEVGKTVPVKVGNHIWADTDPGTVAIFTGPWGSVECNENIMTATVTKNNGEQIQATIEKAYIQSNSTAEATEQLDRGSNKMPIDSRKRHSDNPAADKWRRSQPLVPGEYSRNRQIPNPPPQLRRCRRRIHICPRFLDYDVLLQTER